MLVLAFLCPPLAVLLTATRADAAKNVAFTLLFYIPGVLHALTAVEQYRVQRRYDLVMSILEARGAVPRVLPASRSYAA